MSRNTKAEHESKQAAESKKRFIFEFHDGVKNRKIDVWRALIEIQSQIPMEVVNLSAMNGDGVGKLIEVARKVFAIPRWTEENEAGLTDGQVMEAFVEFMNAVDVEKKSTKRKPTLPVPTALPS